MRRLSLLVVAILFVGGSSTSAEPLRVESGFVFLGAADVGFGLDLGLSGAGFSFLAEVPGDHSFFQTFSPSTPPFRLQLDPNQAIDPSSNSSCPGCGYGGRLTFNFAAGDGATRPFTVLGSIAGFLPASAAPLFRDEVTGGGTLVTGPGFARFDFAPQPSTTPEPASLALLAVGACAAGLRCWRLRLPSSHRGALDPKR